MRLLLDTANIGEIEKWMPSGMFSGVTTNPSLVSKEKKQDYILKLREIANYLEGCRYGKHLSVEVTTLDPEKMVRQAQELNEQVPVDGHRGLDLHVKIPVLPTTMRVLAELRQVGVKTNATACMTALQAKMADLAGADIVSFFYNRIADGGENPCQVLENFRPMKSHNLKVICGSIRYLQDVTRAWERGADYVTVQPKLIPEMLEHAQTTLAVSQFQKDIEQWLS